MKRIEKQCNDLTIYCETKVKNKEYKKELLNAIKLCKKQGYIDSPYSYMGLVGKYKKAAGIIPR